MAAPCHAESKGSGQGANFTITLPVLIAHRATDGVSDSVRQLNEIIPPRKRAVLELGKGRVVWLTTRLPPREIVCTVLVQALAEVQDRPKAQVELFDILDEWLPDVIVADIGMPNSRSLGRAWTGPGPQPTKRRARARALTAYARTADPTGVCCQRASKCTCPSPSAAGAD